MFVDTYHELFGLATPAPAAERLKLRGWRRSGSTKDDSVESPRATTTGRGLDTGCDLTFMA
jgi:hypothetical protein